MAIKVLSRLEEYKNALQYTEWGQRTLTERYHEVKSIRTELKTILKDSASMGALAAMSLAEVSTYLCNIF